MIDLNNRILTMTTMLLSFSFVATAGAQTLISGGTTESGSSTTSTCEMPPSCESLGYTKTADDCANKVTLKCPLDESKLYCADARQNGVCSDGYSEIEKIIPYCTGDNARLVYDTKNPNCAKCQKCGAGSHLSQISGCCPTLGYLQTADGCPGSSSVNTPVKYSNQDSNGCWTCSRCRDQYTLNADGLCVDPSFVGGAKKYAVGDTYVDASGIGIGKVVQITDGGTHGLIAVSGGEGTLEFAQNTCNNKKAGGLDWALGGAVATCQTVHKGQSSYVNHHGTQLTSSCFSSYGNHCNPEQRCSFACEAHF